MQLSSLNTHTNLGFPVNVIQYVQFQDCLGIVCMYVWAVCSNIIIKNAFVCLRTTFFLNCILFAQNCMGLASSGH